MTWTKLSSGFFDQLDQVDFPDHLRDACMLTHAQAIAYLYESLTMDQVERDEIHFQARHLRKFVTSDLGFEAAKELIRKGFWREDGRFIELIHERYTVKGGIGSSEKKAATSRETSKRHRDKKRREGEQELRDAG